MQIVYFGAGKFEIKAKTGTIFLGDQIKIKDFSLAGPGEYEVSGMEAEVLDGISCLRAEEMSIAYLDKRKKPLSEKESERLEEVDILFVPVGGGEVFDTKEAMAAVNQIEPSMVILMHYQDVRTFSKLEGVSAETLNVLKINKNNIDQEKRRIIILNAQAQ